MPGLPHECVGKAERSHHLRRMPPRPECREHEPITTFRMTLKEHRMSTTNQNTSVFTDRELMQFEAAHQRHSRALLMAMPMAAITVLLLLFFIFSGAVE